MPKLHKFLIMTTGSPTMPSEFELTFNASEGLAKIAH